MKLVGKIKSISHIALAATVCACAANPQGQTGLGLGSVSAVTVQEETIASGRVVFDYGDFYTLTSPNTDGCAGDVKNVYDPSSGRALASNPMTPAETIRPAFIKNISVDVTDSNSASPMNQAYGCSNQLGPMSSCATFDYPDDAGLNSNLSGGMLLFGGLQGGNYAGIVAGSSNGGLSVTCGAVGAGANSCGTSVFAVGVNSLPASAASNPPNAMVPGLTSATGAITSFQNLTTSASYNGPKDFQGGAGAYDAGDNLFALFGGSTVLGSVGAMGPAGTNDTTWLFNLKTQSWTQVSTGALVNSLLTETYEQDDYGSRNLANLVSGRMLFGYAAAQGLAVNAMSNTLVAGSPTQLSGGNAYQNGNAIDFTDRIIIAGGQDGSGYTGDSYTFNPTYAPGWVDTLGRFLEANGQTPNGVQAPAAGEPVQWLQNYHTQLLFNTTPTTTPGNSIPQALLTPFPLATANPAPIFNFGLTSVRDNTNFTHSGYLLYLGGFDMSQASGNNPALDSCAAGGGTCAMMISRRSGRALSTAWAGSGEIYPGDYSSVGNLLFPTLSMTSGPTGTTAHGQSYTTTQLTPSYWTSYTANAGVPYYGGSTLLPGFNMDANDVVFFGGADCSNYLLSTASCTSFSNPGVYFRLGTDPLANNGQGAAVPFGANKIATVGAPPARAGVAAARGTDLNGNPLIVAFGGMRAAGAIGDTSIYYLYNAGGTTPTWATATVTSPGPSVVANGALVFSHLTKKFYLFGGYNALAGIESGDTWELSVAPAGCGTAGGCTFSWRQLNVTGGLSCSPICPQGRRSHRMIEANYFNRNPGGSVGVTSGESTCAPTSPCSFGIFMEGGTNDGVSALTDRWMFDPTANDGWGLWQKMNEMPARNLAAMTSVDYTASSTAVHRAILFGGETGFADPSWAYSNSSGSFVAPTLGDTWMFDYDTQTWNRVNLLGIGYNGTPPAVGSTTNPSEYTNRQAYNAQNPAATDSRSTGAALAELSPPPTSGAMMVTRTFSGPSSSNSPLLAIPEVYMIGGRLKDGSYQAFDHVYKFCAGSSGEAYSTPPGGPWVANPNDFTCDGYSTSNPASPFPQSGYIGRWLRKVPAVGVGGTVSADLSSFMGAAAYDSYDDLILVYGGLQFNGVPAPSFYVTDPASRSTKTTNVAAVTPIYEYSPPSAANPQGQWNIRDACAGQASLPTSRYGHSMIYDSRHQQLVLIGGYDANGNPLTQTVTSDSGSYTIPDIWVATRTSTPCYNWEQISTIGNAFNIASDSPPQTGLAHMIATYVPASGYNTGFYSTFDSACQGVGPIASTDPDTSKLLAGGIYFDIDRTQLGPQENLLLNLDFIPLGQANNSPTSTALASSDEAVFRIHLIKTGESLSQLQTTPQPRFLTYTGNSSYPETVQSLAVIAPPTGQARTEQVLIPLSTDPAIDRIRIERYSGSAILVDASLYRMGQK